MSRRGSSVGLPIVLNFEFTILNSDNKPRPGSLAAASN